MKSKLCVTETNLPDNSLLNITGKKYNYQDSYSVTLKDYENKLSLDDVCRAFFTPGPGWIATLMNIRNKIVKVFGLKTSDGMPSVDDIQKLSFRPGDNASFFHIYQRTENELIMGEDDKHLNFRVSLHIKRSNESELAITISTVVIYNNLLGKLYFFPVKPFHKRIVKSMMRDNYSALEL